MSKYQFSTTNAQLAAALMVKGFPYDATSLEDNRVTFCYKKRHPQDLLDSFESDSLSVPARSYAKALAGMMRMISIIMRDLDRSAFSEKGGGR